MGQGDVFDPAVHRVKRVLCFGAHPDDLDFGASGTVAAWTAAGVAVEYCIMTDGDAGGFDTRTLRPEVVLAMHPERNWERIQRSHPDHLACGEAVTRAVYPAVENPFSYPELLQAGLEAYKLPWLWLYGAPAERENHRVEITQVFGQKLAALRQHLSQHPDVPAMERYVRAQCEAQGAAAGFGPGALAEAFHVVAVNAADTIAGF